MTKNNFCSPRSLSPVGTADNRAPIYWWVAMVMFLIFFCWDISVYAAEKGIGYIHSFEKTPHLKSIGAWETIIQKGLPVYSGDKIFSGNGSIQIRFYDECVLTVFPNSIVRVVQSEGIRRKRTLNRDIRVLIGKVKYENAKSSGTKVRIITPTALFSVSDGITVVSYQSQDSENIQPVVYSTKPVLDSKGPMTTVQKETDVPDSYPETAKKDLNFQKTTAAIQMMKEYLEKKHRLEKVKNEHEGDTYQKKSRTDRVTLRDEKMDQKNFNERSIHYAYEDHLKLSGRLEEYAQASLKELIEENSTYSNNPELLFANYSKELKTKAEGTLNRLIELDGIIKKTQKELEDQKRLFDKAEKTKDKIALSYQMVATMETCSGNEKGMYAQTLVIEGLTVGTPSLKESFDFLEPYAKTINTFGGRYFIEDLNTYVKAVLETKEEISQTFTSFYVADADHSSLWKYIAQKSSGKTSPTPSVEKLIKLIEVIGIAVSRYSGLNNLLLNAHEANLLDENSEKVEEELLIAVKEWVNVFEIYNNSVNEFKSLTVDELKKAIKTMIEQSEKIESSDQLFKNFITDYIRLSAVLSPVKGNDVTNLISALGDYIQQETRLNCEKCEQMQAILKQQQRCIDVPQCYRCNPQGQLVPDNDAFCDDGDPCTKNDRCVGGECRGIRILSAEDPNCK